MNEGKIVAKKVDPELMDFGKEPPAPVMIKQTVFQKMKSKVKEVKAKEVKCKGCEKREDTVLKVATMGGKAVVGLGTGVVLGVGMLSVAAIAEIALPAILTFKALGVTCGALGLVKGAKDFDK
ncbi:MAG: hypothetical protein ACOYOS_17855 [Syntrophales bacterium]